MNKNVRPQYPVPYFVWTKKKGVKVAETDMTVEEANQSFILSRQVARPVGEPGSAWQTMVVGSTSTLNKLVGESAYKARIGARAEPYGIYWVEIVDATNPAMPLVVNLPERGKTEIKKLRPTRVESQFLFPALRGRDIGRWKFEQSVWIFVLNRSTKISDSVAESIMRRKWPLTYAYLNIFRDALLSRANYWKFFGKTHISTRPIKQDEGQHFLLRSKTDKKYLYEIAEAPFYNMFNIGPYTFAPFRVCWSRMTNTIKACVVSELDTDLGTKTVVPTDTATIVPFEVEDEAHYFCSIVNSSLFRWCVQSFSSAGRGFGSAAILKRIRIDRFNVQDADHNLLADLSKVCHAAASTEGLAATQDAELRIDQTAAKLLGVTDSEISMIRESLE